VTRALVVTAANEAFFPLLQGLVGSLAQWEPAPHAGLACFDLGLAPAGRAWIDARARHVVQPGWDLPVAARLRDAQPELRALTVRPFLPRYFPGYDVYVWIDADAWVQERFALDWLIEYAPAGALVAVPEIDRAYRNMRHVYGWRTERMHACFGVDYAQRALWDVYVNAGVFALRADAPHWVAWAQRFDEGLAASRGAVCCDQTALNYALWTMPLALHPLPAVCNWLCHVTLPVFDSRHNRYCEPIPPGGPLGILHLAGRAKSTTLMLKGDGWTRPISLRFPGSEEAPS